MRTGKRIAMVMMLGVLIWAAGHVYAQEIDLTLVMPGVSFSPGYSVYLNLDIDNSGPTFVSADVFVALTVGTGNYWFFPSWTQYPPSIDWLDLDIPEQTQVTETILPEFIWPSGTGSFSGAQFLAAVVSDGTLVSDLAEITFGWSEAATPTPDPSSRIQPGDLEYIGAFRLPGGETPPLTFAYGANAMTFNPDGNPGGGAGTLPGSLFITGHDRQAWGTLPDGGQIAEVTIPEPGMSGSPDGLPMAEFVQDFHNALAGHFTEMEEIPRIGMAYLDHPDTGALLHIGWGQHMPPDPAPATHGWIQTTLGVPNYQGTWFIGNYDFNSVNGYLFTIPQAWADAHTGGRMLATGRFRDGGWSGMGPALFAYRPWLSGGAAPASGTHLEVTPLMLYQDSYTSEEIVRCMAGYQHPDEWEGGAWLTASGGRTAVVFAGTKSNGAKYWYGYLHPGGPQLPCVDTNITDFVTCRQADGSPCPSEDFAGCCDETGGGCISLRGWWSTHFDAEIIFYDPAQFAQVAAGTIEPWQPQPYAALDIDEHLYLNPAGIDLESLGWGDQRRYRIGDVAYDAAHGFLYVIELFADNAKPIVHVWQVE